MADRKNEDDAKQPPRHAENPGQPPGQATKPQPKTEPGQSQKAQIAQYFRSQGKQPDDVVWEMQGLKLTLKDLD